MTTPPTGDGDGRGRRRRKLRRDRPGDDLDRLAWLAARHLIARSAWDEIGRRPRPDDDPEAEALRADCRREAKRAARDLARALDPGVVYLTADPLTGRLVCLCRLSSREVGLRWAVVLPSADLRRLEPGAGAG
jgi:hypothetical protein